MGTKSKAYAVNVSVTIKVKAASDEDAVMEALEQVNGKGRDIKWVVRILPNK